MLFGRTKKVIHLWIDERKDPSNSDLGWTSFHLFPTTESLPLCVTLSNDFIHVNGDTAKDPQIANMLKNKKHETTNTAYNSKAKFKSSNVFCEEKAL